MLERSLAVVMTSCGHLDYARQAILSVCEKSACRGVHVFLIDDASSDWQPRWEQISADFQRYDGIDDPLRVLAGNTFPERGGLLRSWNHGLDVACRAHPFDYICVVNDDVLFTQDWDRHLIEAIEQGGYQLVGPLTNAPGTEPGQNIGRIWPSYEPSDDPLVLENQRRQLLGATNAEAPWVDQTLNGFCLFAAREQWLAGRYDVDLNLFFRPRNDLTSKGWPNPDPLSCLGEYELQRRWHARGWKSGLSLRSFVFHYRSISRGDKYRGQNSYRPIVSPGARP